MLIGALSQYFFGFTIFVLSTFLVLLVLVQRGRGGGLTGALGGPGGQSAFGTKAGDLFTRITIGVATAWIILCATAVFMLRTRALPETGVIDRPSANAGMGAGAGGTTQSNDDKLKLDLPKLNLPDLGSPTGLPELKPNELNVPGNDGTAKPATTTPASGLPTAETPAPTAPAEGTPAPATETPAPATGETPAPATNPESTPPAP